MKIQKTEFKSIIKECLKELINEGALDHMVGGMTSDRSQAVQQQAILSDPRIRMAAMQSSGGNAQRAEIMEQIFADTALNSLPEQQAASNRLGNGMPIPQSMLNESTGNGNFPQRNPLPPRESAATTQRPGFASDWARLAFNAPISNRPQSGSSASSGFLPGAKKGSFQ
jgi:hypothetical protein